ncbi:unnamed protein product [Prunus armeniaca]
MLPYILPIASFRILTLKRQLAWYTEGGLYYLTLPAATYYDSVNHTVHSARVSSTKIRFNYDIVAWDIRHLVTSSIFFHIYLSSTLRHPYITSVNGVPSPVTGEGSDLNTQKIIGMVHRGGGRGVLYYVALPVVAYSDSINHTT